MNQLQACHLTTFMCKRLDLHFPQISKIRKKRSFKAGGHYNIIQMSPMERCRFRYSEMGGESLHHVLNINIFSIANKTVMRFL